MFGGMLSTTVRSCAAKVGTLGIPRGALDFTRTTKVASSATNLLEALPAASIQSCKFHSLLSTRPLNFSRPAVSPWLNQTSLGTNCRGSLFHRYSPPLRVVTQQAFFFTRTGSRFVRNRPEVAANGFSFGGDGNSGGRGNSGGSGFQRQSSGIAIPKKVWVFLALGASLYVVFHLEKAPISGRWRAVFVSPKREAQMGLSNFEAIRHQYKNRILPRNHPTTQRIEKIGRKLVASSRIPELQRLEWEFLVVDDPTVNAFVLPGGKVVVFTGILPYAKDEIGLATVLGHEIGHVYARHVAEKLAFSGIVTAIMLPICMMLGISPNAVGWVFDLGLGLPYSRQIELEADRIGMVLMARACYDPREAVKIWQRMEQNPKERIPQVLSTHPTSKNRIQKITEHQEEALEEMPPDCNLHKDHSRRSFIMFIDDKFWK